MKHKPFPCDPAAKEVAPYMGAWIETGGYSNVILNQFVAPYMGAWIETTGSLVKTYEGCASLPIWERGLKPALHALIIIPALSLPIWERGLKQR